MKIHPTHLGLALRACHVVAGLVPGINQDGKIKMQPPHPDTELPRGYADAIDDKTGLNYMQQPDAAYLPGTSPRYELVGPPVALMTEAQQMLDDCGYRRHEWYYLPVREAGEGRDWPRVWDGDIASLDDAKEETPVAILPPAAATPDVFVGGPRAPDYSKNTFERKSVPGWEGLFTMPRAPLQVFDLISFLDPSKAWVNEAEVADVREVIGRFGEIMQEVAIRVSTDGPQRTHWLRADSVALVKRYVPEPTPEAP